MIITVWCEEFCDGRASKRLQEQREECELCLDGWMQSGGLPVGYTTAVSKRMLLAALHLL